MLAAIALATSRGQLRRSRPAARRTAACRLAQDASGTRCGSRGRRRAAGSRCRRRTARGRASGRRVIGQPPRPVIICTARHVDRVDVGSLLAVDLDRDEVLRSGRPRSPRPRTTPPPSRGTSGRSSSRCEQEDGLALAPRLARTPRRPTDTSRPGCARAAAGRGWSRGSAGSCSAAHRPRGDDGSAAHPISLGQDPGPQL